ncbi:MAG: hypothetical protein O2960_07445 [Verrucomicrobia bacterium]|nr:hypothetical protein [Verrucomicrobiota bacterium]
MNRSEPKTDWQAIKATYLGSEDSFRKLSERFGVSFHTLAKRAKRERWAAEKATIGDAVATAMATAALESATEQGKQAGLTAGGLVERVIRETEKWLDRIESRASAGSLDVGEFRGLVSSWREIVEVGRKTFRLDEAPERKANSLVNVQCVGVVNIMPEDVQGGMEPDLDLPDVLAEFPSEDF